MLSFQEPKTAANDGPLSVGKEARHSAKRCLSTSWSRYARYSCSMFIWAQGKAWGQSMIISPCPKHLSCFGSYNLPWYIDYLHSDCWCHPKTTSRGENTEKQPARGRLCVCFLLPGHLTVKESTIEGLHSSRASHASWRWLSMQQQIYCWVETRLVWRKLGGVMHTTRTNVRPSSGISPSAWLGFSSDHSSSPGTVRLRQVSIVLLPVIFRRSRVVRRRQQ